MLKAAFTNQFERDLKRVHKRGKNKESLKNVMDLLISQKPLPKKQRDHKLIGNYKNRRECHLDPDWLLIYKIEGNEIFFERTGSHSDLF